MIRNIATVTKSKLHTCADPASLQMSTEYELLSLGTLHVTNCRPYNSYIDHD